MAITLVDVTPNELVALKPAGVASEVPRDAAADSMITRLAAQGFDDLRLVHRLDKMACGLLIAARSADAAACHAREIAARRWRKFYVALVGVPIEDARSLVGSHRAYLKTDGRTARVVRAGGKPSFLDVVHAASAVGAARASLVVVQLHTGRFHQIRVMLAHLRAPLAGDTVYGGPAGIPPYLEHVLLSAHPVGSNRPRVWRAPAHPDRIEWASSITAVVDQLDARLTRAAELP